MGPEVLRIARAMFADQERTRSPVGKFDFVGGGARMCKRIPLSLLVIPMVLPPKNIANSNSILKHRKQIRQKTKEQITRNKNQTKPRNKQLRNVKT